MSINYRLQDLLDHTQSSYAVLPHSEAVTAQEVAQRAHVRGWQMAKVVVLRDELGTDFMLVLPSPESFDPAVVRRVTGRFGVRLENERELARLFPDCEVGAIPPFGHLYGMRMYVDPCLLEADDLYFQAGNHHEVVLMRTAEYRRIAQPFSDAECLHATMAAFGAH
jgi:Ala-tRNA(Pro) deacylase